VTTETLYRFRCDAPRCDATAIGEKISGFPDDWRHLGSTDHIAEGLAVVRRPATSHGERCIGEFWQHLCGRHRDVFDGHLPRTEGRSGGRGRTSIVTVACSCGARPGRTDAVHILAGGLPGPRRSGERRWWAHLPDDLQWYATREVA
jgi:hypothetical protein